MGESAKTCEHPGGRVEDHGKVCYDCLPSPEEMILTCLNCGKKMTQDKCKLRCECGYFASCSDYY